MAQGVPDRLTFRHYKGGRSLAKRTCTPGEIPGTHFQRLSRPQEHGSVGPTTEKIPSDNTENRSRDRPTSSAVP